MVFASFCSSIFSCSSCSSVQEQFSAPAISNPSLSSQSSAQEDSHQKIRLSLFSIPVFHNMVPPYLNAREFSSLKRTCRDGSLLPCAQYLAAAPHQIQKMITQNRDIGFPLVWAEAILKNRIRVTQLDISHPIIYPNFSIYASLFPNLTSLQVENCDDQDMKTIASLEQLTELTLNHKPEQPIFSLESVFNNYNLKKLTLITCEALWKFKPDDQACPNLEELDVELYGNSDVDLYDCSARIYRIANFTSISKLTIKGNYQWAKSLGTVIPILIKLQQLTFNADVDCDGFRAIQAGVLARNRGPLTHLTLGKVFFTTIHIIALNFLASNVGLTDLKLKIYPFLDSQKDYSEACRALEVLSNISSLKEISLHIFFRPSPTTWEREFLANFFAKFGEKIVSIECDNADVIYPEVLEKLSRLQPISCQSLTYNRLQRFSDLIFLLRYLPCLEKQDLSLGDPEVGINLEELNANSAIIRRLKKMQFPFDDLNLSVNSQGKIHKLPKKHS